jgi:enoyl-CoA hydratase/carnithine racemase
MPKAIRLDARGPVVVMVLNRPPVNAFDEADLHDLEAAAEQIENDPVARVVVITSANPKVFCAGGDLKYWPYRYSDHPDIISAAGQRAFMRMERLSKPVIAAIGGAVIGDGLSLALACDIRLASPAASFQLPEVGYGFVPPWGTVGRLVRTAGLAAASEMLLTGEQVDAAQAHRLGLVNRVIAGDSLLPVAEIMAARMATQPPITLRYAKAMLRGEPPGHTTGGNWESECFAAAWSGREWETGIVIRPARAE